MSTIHSQIAASHEATRITNQESRRTPIFLRPAQPPQHILRRPIRPPFREFFKQAFYHRRDDIAGRDRVNADPVLAPFRGEVAS